MWQLGFASDPWTMRFFPQELGLFVAGGLAFSWWSKSDLFHRLANDRRTALVCVLLPIASVIGAATLVVFVGEAGYWMAYAVTLFGLPFLFEVSKKNRLDRFIGNLSFPIYISHWLVFACFFVLDWSAGQHVVAAVLAVLVCSLGLSQAQALIDVFRQRRFMG